MDIDEVMDIGEGKPRRYEPERRCGAHLRGGEGTCRLPAGHGTDHVGWGQCRKHGDNTATARRHAYHLQALAEMPVMGGEIDVDPIDSLLACIRREAGRVAWLRLRFEALDPEEDLVEVPS